MKILPLFLLPLVAVAADPALTVYNQNFVVVRENIAMDLRDGVNEIKFPISPHNSSRAQ